MVELEGPMLNKLTSTVILTFSFAVMPETGKHPDSLLFLFTSPNQWVSTLRLILAIILFLISFNTFSHFFSHNHKLRKSMLNAGLFMIVFGLVSTLETSLGSVFYDYLKPLDLMIILEAGIVLSSLALATTPVKRPAKPKAATQKAAPKLRQRTA
jgi:predicted MFS family arabinose efflux permease